MSPTQLSDLAELGWCGCDLDSSNGPHDVWAEAELVESFGEWFRSRELRGADMK